MTDFKPTTFAQYIGRIKKDAWDVLGGYQPMFFDEQRTVCKFIAQMGARGGPWWMECKAPWLIVYGDWGEAIYRFGTQTGWMHLEGADFQYFLSKCTASAYGRSFTTWDLDVAQTVMGQMIAGLRTNLDHNARARLDPAWQNFQDEADYSRALCEHFAWKLWDMPFEIDTEDLSRISGCGQVPDFTAAVHWVGLGKAVESYRNSS